MAKQAEVINDPHYIPVHQHGFVGYVDHMGTDNSICQAARVSYGEGTKKISDDRNLIRYLIRHRHTSPVEMCEVKFHIKLPIFVMRQLIRHRTASVNEYSGRYSEMVDEFYIPEMGTGYLKYQSTTNKQGREGDVILEDQQVLRTIMGMSVKDSYDVYQAFLQQDLARELARIVLPVSNYTECYWKTDLHNLFHMLKLRLDPHAQKEIVDYAEAIYKIVQPLYPLACEAFEDYIRQARTFSRMELKVLKSIIGTVGEDYYILIKNICIEQGMSQRETTEFLQFIKG